MDLSGAFWGIAGILATVFFYKIGEKTKKLNYTVSSQPLITKNISQIEGLNITLYDEPIDSLTSTTIKIQSVGKDNIEMTDFAKAEPLSIKVDGKFILNNDKDSILTYNSNDSNTIDFDVIDNTCIQLTYDFFSYYDEIHLTLLHTGNISVGGKLKKGKIRQVDLIKKKGYISDIISIFGYVIGLLVVILICFVEKGIGFFASLGLILFFNIILGVTLIDYFYNKKKNS